MSTINSQLDDQDLSLPKSSKRLSLVDTLSDLSITELQEEMKIQAKEKEIDRQISLAEKVCYF